MTEKLNIHCLQHVAFEGLGCIEEWLFFTGMEKLFLFRKMPPGYLSPKDVKIRDFLYEDHVLGLQFHFEVTPPSMREMAIAGQNELIEAKYIQSLETILQTTPFIEQNNKVMFGFLDFLLNNNSKISEAKTKS